MTDWTRVQGAQAQLSPASNVVQISLTNPVGGGNIMLVEAITSLVSGIVSAVDDGGNNYLWVGIPNPSNNPVVAFYPDPDSATFGLLTNGPKKLTITFSGTPAYFWYDQTEFAPPSGTLGITLNGHNHNAGTLLNSTDIAEFTTDNADCLLYMTWLSSGVTATGAGWTAGAGSTTAVMSQWKIQAAAGVTGTNSVASNSGAGSGICIGIAPVKRNNWLPIQNVFNHAGSTGTSIAAGVQNAIGNGNYVVGMFANNSNVAGADTTNLTSFTDDQGKTWSISGQLLLPNFNGRTLFWLGPFTNGAKTLTANVGASSSGLFLAWVEYRPPPTTVSVATDGFAQTQANTPPTTVGPVTTTNVKDLLFVMEEPSSGTAFPTDGFSALVNGQTWNMGYRNAPSPGSYSSTWSYAAGSNDMFLAGFAPTFPATNLQMLPQRLIQ